MAKIVLITSDALRHNYIAWCLSKQHDVVLRVAQAKSPSYDQSSKYEGEESKLISDHFEARGLSERSFFEEYEAFSGKTLTISHRELNTDATLVAIAEEAPEAIVLFGCGIVNERLLSTFDKKVVNIHLGLSPYYRGSGTNFWPLYYQEPECIGATIHLASAEVDAGDILCQVRPATYTESDTIHSLGNKTIHEAGQRIGDVLERYLKAELQGVKQPKDDNEAFKKKDFNPAVLRKVIETLPDTMHDFIQDMPARLASKPIVECKS